MFENKIDRYMIRDSYTLRWKAIVFKLVKSEITIKIYLPGISVHMDGN